MCKEIAAILPSLQCRDGKDCKLQHHPFNIKRIIKLLIIGKHKGALSIPETLYAS